MTDLYKQMPDAAHTTAAPDENTTKTENSAAPEPSPSEAENSAGLKYFLPEDTTRSSITNLLSEDACRKWVISFVHAVARCPECHTSIPEIWQAPCLSTQHNAFLAGKRLACKACGKEFTARTGTFLQGAQLSYAQVLLLAILLDLMESGITPARIAPLVGVSADTVRLWQKKFKAFEGHGR